MLIDLARTSIGDAIRRLSIERKSGDLHVRSGKLTKIVFFDHGRLVFAASNLKKDRLGEALLALGRITDLEFSRVSALMTGDRKRRFGEALVAAGVMSLDAPSIQQIRAALEKCQAERDLHGSSDKAPSRLGFMWMAASPRRPPNPASLTNHAIEA